MQEMHYASTGFQPTKNNPYMKNDTRVGSGTPRARSLRKGAVSAARRPPGPGVAVGLPGRGERREDPSGGGIGDIDRRDLR
jgi:hypothetical protein